MKHWARDLVGMPWAPDADGPARFSCWGLVRFVFRTQRGIEMPSIQVGDPAELHAESNVRAIKAASEISGWRRVETKLPLEWDIAVMRRAGLAHVGVVIKVDGLLRLLESSHGPGVTAFLWRDAVSGARPELWRLAA